MAKLTVKDKTTGRLKELKRDTKSNMSYIEKQIEALKAELKIEKSDMKVIEKELLKR